MRAAVSIGWGSDEPWTCLSIGDAFVIQTFAADALYHHLGSLDGRCRLREDLESLTIGLTPRRLSLEGLARFVELKRLYLAGRRVLGSLGQALEVRIASSILVSRLPTGSHPLFVRPAQSAAMTWWSALGLSLLYPASRCVASSAAGTLLSR